MKIRNPKLRGGHAPGHVRDTFLEALMAFESWRPGEPEPTVMFEVHYEPQPISLSRACTLVWNCSDILPQDAALERLEHRGKRTYAAAARALLTMIREQPAVAA